MTEEQLREWAEEDPGIAAFLAAQEAVVAGMQTAEICHMAESFGRPGSLTEHGRKYKALTYQADWLNLAGLLYLLKQGRIHIDDISIDATIFKGLS